MKKSKKHNEIQIFRGISYYRNRNEGQAVLWGIVVEMFPELTGNASLDQSFHSILLLSSSSIGSKLFQV